MWDEGPYSVEAWYCRDCGISLPTSGPAYFQYGPAPAYCWRCRGDEPLNINQAFSSKYLKHSDLNGKRVLVTIDQVTVETIGQGNEQEQKPVLYFQGKDKGMVLNKTNAFSIAEIVGSEDTDHWKGHRIVLHQDRTMYQGKPTSCIRVAAPPQDRKAAPPPPPPQELVEDFGPGADDEPPF